MNPIEIVYNGEPGVVCRKGDYMKFIQQYGVPYKELKPHVLAVIKDKSIKKSELIFLGPRTAGVMMEAN